MRLAARQVSNKIKEIKGHTSKNRMVTWTILKHSSPVRIVLALSNDQVIGRLIDFYIVVLPKLDYDCFISTDRLTSLRPKPPVAILPLGKGI